MALSYTQWQGDGVTQTFPISFEYIAKEHVGAIVNLDPVSFTWDDNYTIRISPAPANGAVVEARRTTPRDQRLVDFSDGSTLTESDLDLAAIQTFYIVQEAIDIAGGTLELLADGSYGAGGRRIKELGLPVEERDAVTKGWAETAMSSQLTGAIAAMNAAVVARDEAQAHRAASASSATSAAGSASTATSQAGLADTARVAAQTARDAALAYRDAALGYRSEAQGFRNEAEGFKNAAAASAAAAATWNPANYYDKPATDGLLLGKMRHGGCRLGFSNNSTLLLTPHNGNRLIIDGVERVIPSAGVAAASAAPDSARYVYAYWTGTAVALEQSTTGFATHTDGVIIKSGDPTRTLVGFCYFISGGVGFAQSGTHWTVRSWFHDTPFRVFNSNGGQVDLSSGIQGPWATVYLLAWPNEIITISANCIGFPLSVAQLWYVFVYADGGAAENAVSHSQAGYYTRPVASVTYKAAAGLRAIDVRTQNASGNDYVRSYAFQVSAVATRGS